MEYLIFTPILIDFKLPIYLHNSKDKIEDYFEIEEF